MGRRFKREGTDVYLWLIHVDVWQKPTHYEAIVLQLKINKNKKRKNINQITLKKRNLTVLKIRHFLVTKPRKNL